MATEQQLKNRELATQNIAQGVPQNTGIADTAISVNDLQQTQTPINTVQPDIPSTFDVSGLDTDLPEIVTPQADKATALTTRIEEIQKGLLPQTAFTAEKKEEFGLPTERKAEEDLVAQIKGLQLKSLDLANQKQLAAERIQLESEGRGRTRGGTAPLTAAAQRRITLQQADITSQALTASATLSAVQGRIVTATRQVEEAVQQKFGTLKAEKDALIENLDLLLASGTLDREETKRAEEQKQKQEAEQKQIDERAADQLDIWNIGISSAPILANVPNGGEILKQIQNAGSKEEAFNIAFTNGVFLPDAPQNTFDTRLDANGNLVQFEKAPDGSVVGQKMLSTKAVDEEEGVTAISPDDAIAQLTFLEDTAKSALDLAHAAGRSILKEGPARLLFGATDKTRLEAFTNTLRTNVLTLMTDPSIKKFFGPQMSEADVRLMTSAGTTLNPDLQSPDDLRTEIGRLDKLLKDMKTAVELGRVTTSTERTVTAPDGTQVIIID
jgi:hypothetical protein